MDKNSVNKISVVTVCLNSATTISHAIESVKSQSFEAIEYIVVDGGSTDETIEIVKKNANLIDRFISEKDNGIYDAMNKGIEMATGDAIYFLNSDDSIHDKHVVRDVVDRFNEQSTLDLLYGNVIYKDDDHLDHRSFHHLTKKNILFENLCHQAVFAKRQLFLDLGKFDLEYKIVADYDWLLKIFFSNYKFAYFNRDIAYFNAQGAHTLNPSLRIKERMQVKYKCRGKLRYAVDEVIFRFNRKMRRKLGR